MSKCYVIKNKDGKYMSEICEFETNQLWQAQLFDRKEIAEFYCNLKGYEVVECAICEGDLEKELEVYKRAFDQMAVEYAIVNGLTDVRDVQYAILDKAREEVEKGEER